MVFPACRLPLFRMSPVAAQRRVEPTMPRPPRSSTKTARINQQAVAERLGISVTTVSRSLQDHPDIAPATKRRVLEEADRLGYRGRTSGADMARCVTVIIASAEPKSGMTLLERGYLQGLSMEAQTEGLLLATHCQETSQAEILRDPQRWPVALRTPGSRGLLLIHRLPDAVVESLALGHPTVSLVHAYAGAPCDVVDSDHATGYGHLIDLLAQHGHRRMAWAMVSDAPLSLSRFGSFMAGLARQGLSEVAAPQLILPEGPKASAALREQVQAALRLGVTAVVADRDSTALRIWQVAQELGLEVPRDLSIVGFDGVDAQPGGLALTTIAIPYQEMGRQALRRLLVPRGLGAIPTTTSLRGRLIPGATSGPAPRR